jgi:acetyltransferase-like isoleucine patch superfamily enzyme
MRRSGILVDPSVELRSSGDFRNRLFLGKGVAIDKGSILHLGSDCGCDGVIEFGPGVYVGPYCQIVSSHRLEIGENSLIGGFSYLITVNHRTEQTGVSVGKQGYRGANIKIGKNVNGVRDLILYAEISEASFMVIRSCVAFSIINSEAGK